jgi:hypothetical protein
MLLWGTTRGDVAKTIMTGSNLETSPYEIRRIGAVAFDLLSTGSGGTVLASFSRAVYLLCEHDQLVWIAPETSPMHRRCLQVSSPLLRMGVGTGFHIREGRLVTENGQSLDFGRSPVWEPPVLPLGELVLLSRLVGLVQRAYRRLIAGQAPYGWGVLIPAILQTVSGQAVPKVADNGVVLSRNVWPAVKAILEACLPHDFGLILPHATRLVGLGTGLTPSGDDFLGGLFFASTLLRSVYPEIPDLQTWNYADFILGCKSQTNLISFTLLKDLSEGHALEPMHLFANSLLEGQPVDQSQSFAGALAGVGHSTGWDVLTGFLVGMSVACPQ